MGTQNDRATGLNNSSLATRHSPLAFSLREKAKELGFTKIGISRAERATGVRKNEEKAWEERDHGLFVAFAPNRAPRYAVAVVVEHGGSGSQSAAPIARDIMAKALELDPARAKPAISLERRAAPSGAEA